MRKILIALLLPLVLIMSACSPQVTAGTVTDKVYAEAYQTEEEIMEEVCENERKTTGTGKNRKTKTVRDCDEEATGEFETIDHPAVYTLVLEDKENNTGEVDVTEAEYNSVEIGDFFDSEASNG